MSCMEAFAGGLVPAIANSPKSATPQFALDERSLFPAGDSAALAEKIAEAEAKQASEAPKADPVDKLAQNIAKEKG